MAQEAAARKRGRPGVGFDVSPGSGWESVSPQLLDQVKNAFEEFGLNGHQAKILVALLRLGAASPPQLAHMANVHRTSAYPVLQELRARGLVQQLPGESALWTTGGPDEVLSRLQADYEERLRSVTGRVDATRKLLTDIAPRQETQAVPYVHILANASQARSAYDRLVTEATEEILVLNRPPYSAAVERKKADRLAAEEQGRDEVNADIVDALNRGVSIRVLYETKAWHDSPPEFVEAMTAYHQAGVKGRIVDELPMKLVITDRSRALFALADPVMRELGFPMNLLIEHPGYCAFQADAFEYQWAKAKPCPQPRRSRQRTV